MVDLQYLNRVIGNTVDNPVVVATRYCDSQIGDGQATADVRKIGKEIERLTNLATHIPGTIRTSVHQECVDFSQ